MENNNADLIDDLNRVASYLKLHPKFPKMDSVSMYLHVDGLDQFKEAARNFGSFTKHFDDFYVRLTKIFSERTRATVTIGRSKVCKQTITWDCPPELESILAAAEVNE